MSIMTPAYIEETDTYLSAEIAAFENYSKHLIAFYALCLYDPSCSPLLPKTRQAMQNLLRKIQLSIFSPEACRVSLQSKLCQNVDKVIADLPLDDIITYFPVLRTQLYSRTLAACLSKRIGVMRESRLVDFIMQDSRLKEEILEHAANAVHRQETAAFSYSYFSNSWQTLDTDMDVDSWACHNDDLDLGIEFGFDSTDCSENRY